MKSYAIRLKPNDEIRKSLEDFVKEKNIRAGCIVTCVGCVNTASLRMAGAKKTKEFNGDYEIVSLVGTLEPGNGHLHISLSNEDGKVYGGHLKYATVGTTAEIVIGEIEGVQFSRMFDKNTGFKELTIG